MRDDVSATDIAGRDGQLNQEAKCQLWPSMQQPEIKPQCVIVYNIKDFFALELHTTISPCNGWLYAMTETETFFFPSRELKAAELSPFWQAEFLDFAEKRYDFPF